MRKKGRRAENIRRRQLHKILDLVLDISGMQENEDDHPTAYLFLSGYTGAVDVDIYRSDLSADLGFPEVKIEGMFRSGSSVYPHRSLSTMIETLKAEKGRYQK